MSELKVGDRVNIVRRDGHYVDFKNPGTVTDICGAGYVDVQDSSGLEFTGGMSNRYQAFATADRYIVDGGDTIYALYSMAEEAARSIASEFGDPVAIAKVIAYAKPTVSITVERV